MKLSYILHNIAYFLGLEKTYHKQALYRLFDACNNRYFEGCYGDVSCEEALKSDLKKGFFAKI